MTTGFPTCTIYEEPNSSSARVDIITPDNATLYDAFQFDHYGFTGATGCTGPQWNMVGQNFRLDIKANDEAAATLLSLTSVAGEIVVDDETNRILHFNVPEATLTAALIPGEYVYDFIMYSNDVPAIRVPLMHGKFVLTHGVTGG